MKKFFLISFLFFGALGVATGHYEITAASVVGVSLAVSSKKNTGYAFLTILPAKLFDPMGQEIPPLTRAQKKMFDFLRAQTNEVTKQAIADGAVMWDHITYYIRYIITGLSGRQKIVGPATQDITGTSNIPNNAQLPQYYNFCYDRIEIGYVNTAVNLDTVANIVGYSSVLGSMGAGLRNGEIIVSLNKKTQLETPVTDFGSKAAVTGGGALDFDGGELQDPNVIQENLQWEVELNFAQAIASAANNTYATEVLFKGIQARLR